MKHLLSILLLCWSFEAWTQPIQRNAATTNSEPKLPNVLPTDTSPLFPLSVLNPDGSGADRRFQHTPGFFLTGTNMTTPGSLSLNGRSNLISITATNTLNFDGVPVATGSPTTTNTVINSTTVNSTTINSSTVNYHLAKGSQLILTNDLLFAWNVLTMSGSNVSTISLTNGLMHKLTLTNNAFINAPTDFPGTNFGRTFQIHVAQDGTGGRTLMLTNSSWRLTPNGSTNQVAALTTNANAITVLTFTTSPFSSSLLYGVVTPF